MPAAPRPHPDAPKLRDRLVTLATDLDGTFLGGSETARKALYDWIEARRGSVGLIFVTGRDPAFITDLVRTTPVPCPDYVIGDVGTTIAAVASDASVHPLPALEADISDRWQGRGRAVRAALDGHPGLTLQDTGFRHRVSYDLHPDLYDPASADLIHAMGLDTLISDNRFFDVLPPGVSKGPSLRRLVEHLGLDPARVLAAGDTLNDLSMLTCGLPAVAVGNAEPPLRAALADDPDVYRARAHGAAGIAEALAALDLHPDARSLHDAL